MTAPANRWTTTEARNFLAKGGWFGALPSTLQDKILGRSEIVQFAANTALYRIGDTADGLYAMLEGDVRAFAQGDDGELIFFRAIGPGTWIGNVPLMGGAPVRTVEVRCVSPATALFLPEPAYRELTETDRALHRAFVELLCIHVRNAVRVMVESRSEAPRRTARALLRLARAHGIPADNGTRLAIALSQADLASLVGVSRQYMNELIARWETEGLLRWSGKSQPLLDTERLRGLLSPFDLWIEGNDDWI